MSKRIDIWQSGLLGSPCATRVSLWGGLKVLTKVAQSSIYIMHLRFMAYLTNIKQVLCNGVNTEGFVFTEGAIIVLSCHNCSFLDE